ncbi:MAG: LptA/OstA family protein [Trueperaceae bacterium]
MRFLYRLFVILLLVGFGLGQDGQQQSDGVQETTPELEENQASPQQQDEAASPEDTSNLNLPTLTIKRKEREIIVAQKAPNNRGGRVKLNADKCDDKNPELIVTTFYGPAPYFVETRVNEAVITSNIASSRQPENKEDAEGNVIERGNDEAILELYGGTVEFIEERGNERRNCPINVKRTETADVTLKEGRTTINGVNFTYDNSKGLANMKGPITLDRVAEGESPALNATADNLENNVDDDKTFLTGNVKVTSEDRVSEATSLEYDEENGLAILRGDAEKDIPAKSTKDGDVLQGDIIIYYLDSNDVVVEGGLQGEIEVDLEEVGEGTTTTIEPVTEETE